MALKTRKTPSTRGKRAGTGTTARGQGNKTNMTGRGRKGANAGNNAMGNNSPITAQNISTFQQWLRFGQKNNLLSRLFASPLHQTELQKFQSNQPANLSAGGRRTAQERQAATA